LLSNPVRPDCPPWLCQSAGVLPPHTEQTTIVAHIETECSRLDTIIDTFKKQIELFNEYRATLISEVVTGKIDVRDEVPA
jgi:type I restriction enzyme S subunit